LEPQIVLLFGRPGVGKFTVGRALAAETGFRLLHNHAVVDLVAALFAFGTPPFVALRERLWLDAVDAALGANLPGLILTFAPERTVPQSFLDELRSHTVSGGGTLRLVELRCAPDALDERLEDRSREAFGKLRDAKQYHELEAGGAFSHPIMPPAEIVIDTTEQAPADAARQIALHLRRSHG
jgi:broad-specificity NMP kinase